MNTIFSRVGLVALALVAVACGSKPADDTTEAEGVTSKSQPEPSPKSAASAKASVCTMLPKAEMEMILGGPLTNADATDSAGKTQCTYAGFGGRYADVAIEWGNGEAGMAGARLAGKFMGATAGSVQVMTPIEGLGDEAMMMIGGVLNVRHGADLITIDLRTRKNAEMIGSDIARRVIERM